MKEDYRGYDIVQRGDEWGIYKNGELLTFVYRLEHAYDWIDAQLDYVIPLDKR